MLHASPKDEFNDGTDVNPSANPHINDLLTARLSRRNTLKGGIGLTASVLLGSVGLTACGGGDDDGEEALKLGFSAVSMNMNDVVTVPAGYQVNILHALGDSMHWGDSTWADNGTESAESYNRRIGDGHDGMHYFGLSEAGKFLDEAVKLEKDPNTKAEYLMRQAQILGSKGAYGAARVKANEAAGLKPGWGDPYIYIGSLYLSTSSSCGSDACSQTYGYWAAEDMFIKARSVDANVASEAAGKIAQARKYFPTQKDCFFLGIQEGQTVTVGGWIGAETKARFAN